MLVSAPLLHFVCGGRVKLVKYRERISDFSYWVLYSRVAIEVHLTLFLFFCLLHVAGILKIFLFINCTNDPFFVFPKAEVSLVTYRAPGTVSRPSSDKNLLLSLTSTSSLQRRVRVHAQIPAAPWYGFYRVEQLQTWTQKTRSDVLQSEPNGLSGISYVFGSSSGPDPVESRAHELRRIRLNARAYI